MTITPNSLAAINGVGVDNVQFAVTASVKEQKNIIIATFDEATFTSLATDIPFRVFNAADVGGKTGYGFMLHRLAKAAFKAGIIETWVIPQLEGGSDPDQAIGELDFSASASVKSGTIAGYIAGDRVAISTSKGQTAIAIGTAFTAAINNDEELPVEAVDGLDGKVALTSKSGGEWGDDISLAFSLKAGEALPSGVAVTVTDMTGGSGTPDIQDALDSLGTGDAQNDDNFTNLIHGYGQDTATLDAISVYNGEGDAFIGNYKKEIARPFRSLVGDITPGTAGLAAALALAENRKETDRTNGLVCAPGSYNHPQEIAAFAAGIMGVINSIRAQEPYFDRVLNGFFVGEVADRWTNDYDLRDQAVRGGVGTTFAKNGKLTLQNIITFYRPAAVAPTSNAYRSMRNLSIIANMLSNYKANFEQEEWKGISLVEDVTEVSNVTDRLKARDVDSALDDLVALADAFAGKSWLYNSSFTKGELQKGDKVTLRDGLTGFDIIFPVILSGEGGIFNSVIQMDTSIAILTAGGA